MRAYFNIEREEVDLSLNYNDNEYLINSRQVDWSFCLNVMLLNEVIDVKRDCNEK